MLKNPLPRGSERMIFRGSLLFEETIESVAVYELIEDKKSDNNILVFFFFLIFLYFNFVSV